MSTSIVAPLPTVKVGGRSYSVRWSQAAFYLLGTWGVDVGAAVSVHNRMIAEGRGREYEAKLACAPLGNLDAEGRWHSLALSPLEVMDSLLDGEWGPLSEVTWSEYKKKLGLVMTTEVPPTQETSALKNNGSNTGPSEPVEAQAA